MQQLVNTFNTSSEIIHIKFLKVNPLLSPTTDSELLFAFTSQYTVWTFIKENDGMEWENHKEMRLVFPLKCVWEFINKEESKETYNFTITPIIL